MRLGFSRRASRPVVSPLRKRWRRGRSLALVLAMPVALLGAPSHGVALSGVSEAAWMLLPHRAVYDLEMDTGAGGNQISNVAGRLVFEISGSPCEGFTQNMRMVTQVSNSRGGGQTTDIRTSSWEPGDASSFRFTSSLFANEKKAESSKGAASRKENGSVEVDLQQPNKVTKTFDGRIMFPAQHSIAVLEAARKGQASLETQIYDGSDGGKKIYSSTTIIGPGRVAAETDHGPLKVLSGKKAWPVSIAFFDGDDKASDDATPVYELAFQYFENGVSGNLRIAYRTFALKGRLIGLEVLPASKCEKPR